ncbi:MAG: recombination protein RecR [Bacteroidetes bacterium]|nr:recombination protein RecR [Bacteroidota bacterium]MBT5528357.1 recombination protein RecR [Cytophagia bacterium]MBT3800702.1 recombination protein RecR [Bacteroidota bacterium]MBT4970793.1 recombination protein RecR [Bacteroidota bacterium]MBT5990881.1 recombination protein RecR [Bacteroidota bacterium]
MEYPSNIIKELVDAFVKLPGIGKRTALRMVLSLLKQEEEDVKKLGELVLRMKTDIQFCQKCHTISDNKLCHICSDNNRESNVICIIEDHRDLIAIENTKQFNGLYHVLGGVVSPIDGIGPEDLKIDSFVDRVRKDKPKEVVFALRATMEGDTTMYYISNLLKELNIKVSAISRGISIGGELEFADEVTLGRSIVNRTNYTL